MNLHNVTLEMSLKPFVDLRETAVRSVCRELFQQWQPLLRHAKQASVLLWTADGSEILDYRGKGDDEIAWAKYIGIANPKENIQNDPDGRALHSRPYEYTKKPPKITYNDLAMIVQRLKQGGSEILGIPVRIGATFDPGPEFAPSAFKYERHPEICLASTGGKENKGFVTCYATLNQDSRSYAGFPDGIEQDTPLGTFLGRQCRCFLADMGFDYIWFSNGFGFGLETWGVTGRLFDGEHFYPEQVSQAVESIKQFWTSFRAACPEIPVEPRGTNLTVGTDIASDGVDYDWLHSAGLNVSAPPNSPWAALNSDFGLELVGYMSRIAELPTDVPGYPFRFYTHDPWWLNSPWLDRYGRQPHDIYLPMSVSRMNDRGIVETPSSIEFLTVDDSYGRMPVKVPNEVIPHILQAVDHVPDAPGPFVWVYPFEQYHEVVFGEARDLTWPMFGDWFIRGAVNNGLPLNTVISDRNFVKTFSTQEGENTFNSSILILPLPRQGHEMIPILLDRMQAGQQMIFYGPARNADPGLLEALNLSNNNEPISNQLTLHLHDDYDNYDDVEYPQTIFHRGLYSAGGCCETLAREGGISRVIAMYNDGKTQRIAAVVCEGFPGKIAWVRGTVSGQLGTRLITPDDPETFFIGETLLRMILREFGWSIRPVKSSPLQPAVMSCISRCRNGFYWSGYLPDLTVGLSLSTPLGCPIFTGYDVRIRNSHTQYALPRAWHEECRVFIAGQTSGTIRCWERKSGEIGVSRRIHLRGLEKATVRFLTETDSQESFTIRRPEFLFRDDLILPHEWMKSGNRVYAEIADISGEVMLSW